MEKSGRWEQWEKDYIFKSADISTDAEIGTHLGRTTSSIIEMRRRLKIKKNKKNLNPQDVNNMLMKRREIQESTTIQELDDAQKRRRCLNELGSSPAWTSCKLSFDEYELDVYKKMYVEYMVGLENVTEIEKGTIHIMISAHIRIDRYQKLEKQYRDMSKGGNNEVAGEAISLHREMKDMVEVYMKAQDELNASRKQRIKEEGDQRLNLIELIKELDKKESREKLGRESDALHQIQKLEDIRLNESRFIR
jgi:hypothetical protein